VVFCNEECRSKGWNKFHMKECPVFSQLHRLGGGGAFISAYRIIAAHNLDELKGFVTQFQKVFKKSPLDQIHNEDQICDSDSYRSIYFLEGNIKNMETKKLYCLSIIAFIMTQLLIKSNRFFVNNTGDKSVPDIEDVIFIGSLFIRHIAGVCCNAYGVKETPVIVNKKNFSKQELSIGSGTYIAESLFNHSCIPSAFIFFYGNVGVCRATRYIPSGSQVNICYIEIYYSEPDRNIRRKSLFDAYSFICNCDVCLSNCKLSLSGIKMSGFTFPKLRTKDNRVSRNDFENTASLKKELCLII
ncbi:unnamed protein product, partial [Meganyctiphanes norvegica]